MSQRQDGKGQRLVWQARLNGVPCRGLQLSTIHFSGLASVQFGAGYRAGQFLSLLLFDDFSNFEHYV